MDSAPPPVPLTSVLARKVSMLFLEHQDQAGRDASAIFWAPTRALPLLLYHSQNFKSKRSSAQGEDTCP